MTEKLAFTIGEAAEALSLSRSDMTDLVYSRQIRSIRVLGRVLIPRAALDDFLSGNIPAPRPFFRVEQIVCPACGSASLRKQGGKRLSEGVMKQRYMCKDCGYTLLPNSRKHKRVRRQR